MVAIKRYEEYNSVDEFINDSRLFVKERITGLRMQEKNGDRELSEYELSRRIGKNNGYIQKISSGQSMPSVDALIDICAYFQISLEEFFHEDVSIVSEDVNREKDIKELMKIVSYLTKDDISILKQMAIHLSKNGKQ